MQSTPLAKIFGDREDPRRRLQELFGGDLPESGQPPVPALQWAREVLGQSTADPLVAVALLRRAEPRLTLRAATFLAQHALR
ncbi:hypothetical protein C5B96_15200 [Subtercola sp. Z020]|uniref:hypothetical protein n=1 Tax=Subtercola sp. Z020 TaxID=2080582 RepID=UPI000CE746DE|nr:hypothetical protein [Subtercola sp. Z020]PPF77681.1 hypothetical protein C5B96_15200 [Subtercola sp. Z020]